MKIKRSIFLCVNLLLLLILSACGGDGGSSSSGTTPDTNDDAPVTGESITLSSSLEVGELLAKQGEITIYADVTGNDGLPVSDGYKVWFEASSGSITEEASTRGGRATATYKATNIGGEITIKADTGIGGVVDEYTLTVASGPAVQIVTESVEPSSLGLRGSGTNEVGTFTFKVTDGTGGPVQDGQEVRFSLESPTGGAEFLSDPVATTVDGIVTISLISGNVAGVATVTATTESEVGTITTQARITIGSNEPDQLHLGFKAEKSEIAGLGTFGLENTLTAYVADRYSNPVPANTPVYFAGECGIVSLTDSDGNATNMTNSFGQATATAITAEPVPTDGLCKYIYWTKGQESYTDTNGNGMYDTGEPHQDIGEPYIDANDSGTYDSDETYFDLDENGAYTDVDGVWQGNTFVWTDINVEWTESQSDTNNDSTNSIFSLSGNGSDVSEKFTIEEAGNYLFEMSYNSSSDNYAYANFDLKTASGNVEDYLEFVDAGEQQTRDVELEAGEYYISVSATDSEDWAVEISKY